MPRFTPKLDGLIRSYGDFMEAQLKDMMNPDMGSLKTALRIGFRTRTKGIPLRNKIHAATGWDIAADPEKHLTALVELAERHGSTAAQKLKAAMPAFTKMMSSLDNLPEKTGLLKGMRQAKKLNPFY